MVMLMAWAPKSDKFEGTITYEITYLELPENVQGLESMLPSEMKMYFKGQKIALDQAVMGGSQRIVVDNEDSSSFILMDMLGQKICVVLTKEELRGSAKKQTKPNISYIDEKKKILKYNCKKAIVKQDSSETTVYYTDKLNIEHHQDFEYLNGFPLEYETNSNGMKMRITATAIDENAVRQSEFIIPEGYTKMSMEELQEMMGG